MHPGSRDSFIASPQNAQNPQTETNAMLPSAQLAIESCRDLVSIYTNPPVDRHPRDSRAEDSAHSLQPTPIWDLSDKFSSISYPALPSINYLNSSKSASQVNKPRVLRKLVSPFDFAGNKKTIDRHINECRSTPEAAQTGSIYTPPLKARRHQQSSTTPPIS